MEIISDELPDIVSLDPTTGNYGIHILAGQWHTLEVLQDNSVKGGTIFTC